MYQRYFALLHQGFAGSLAQRSQSVPKHGDGHLNVHEYPWSHELGQSLKQCGLCVQAGQLQLNHRG